MRDFRSELAGVSCWDDETGRIFLSEGIPRQDRVLQHPEELLRFCEWIEEKNIRSYLEIGIWTGRLVNLLHKQFRFDRVAVCDVLGAAHYGLPIRVHTDVEFFAGSSHSVEYRIWRELQPPFDLVMIDGDHSYEGVMRDYNVHRALGDRYLAFHDICGGNGTAMGVTRFWTGLQAPVKEEIVSPDSKMGIGIIGKEHVCQMNL